jgi:predicted HicB family RNase H-like nuclease
MLPFMAKSSKKVVTLRLRPAQHRKIKITATNLGWSVQRFCERAAERYLNEMANKAEQIRDQIR